MSQRVSQLPTRPRSATTKPVHISHSKDSDTPPTSLSPPQKRPEGQPHRENGSGSVVSACFNIHSSPSSLSQGPPSLIPAPTSPTSRSSCFSFLFVSCNNIAASFTSATRLMYSCFYEICLKAAFFFLLFCILSQQNTFRAMILSWGGRIYVFTSICSP